MMITVRNQRLLRVLDFEPRPDAVSAPFISMSATMWAQVIWWRLRRRRVEWINTADPPSF